MRTDGLRLADGWLPTARSASAVLSDGWKRGGPARAKNAGLIRRIAIALALVLAAAMVRWLVDPWLGMPSGLMLFVPAVMASTWYGGIWPGLVAMALAAIAGASTSAHPLDIFDAQNHEAARISVFLLVGLFIAISTDLLHRRTREARAANQAKDQFIRILSHELRTPLAPALMTAAALAGDTRLPDEWRDQMKLIQRNLALEGRLIDDLLDISSIQKGKLQLKREIVDLESVLKETIGTCAPGITAKHLNLHMHCDGGPYHVNGDPARLQQIFWNLLRNAVKFTPDRGAISINIAATDAATVSVQVTDSGMGIPRHRLSRIFNAFDQGDESIAKQFGGLGLGLAITRALIDMHGGTIHATSDGPGRGATFIVNLPASQFPVSAPLNPAAAKAESSGLRILYVEDHADTRQVMVRLLEQMGHTVTAAGTMDAAIACARRDHFDLLISDLTLPDGDGAVLLGRLRAAGSVHVGVALSGHGMEDDIRRTRAAGYSAHLIKPLEPAELQSVLATLPRRID